MDPNFIVPPDQVPMNYFLNFVPQNYFPIQDLPLPDPPKQIKRFWSKQQVKELCVATNYYCFINQKTVDSLDLEDFEVISMFANKPAINCMKKIKEISVTGSLAPGAWSFEEDELLKSLMTSKIEKWGFVADYLNANVHSGIKIRSGKQCKERWINHLDPDMKRDKWTKDEDLKVLRTYKNLGKKWCQIAKIIGNRTDSAIKNRVKSMITKHKQSLGNVNEEIVLNSLIEKSEGKNE